MLRFVLALISFSSVFALDHYEELPTKLLEIFPNNIIVLNRGRNDGINLKDHIKLVSVPAGFSARGIAVKTTPNTSHWKIFRIVYPDKVSKDLPLKIISLNPAPLPPSYRYLSNNDYIAQYLKKRRKKIADIIKNDLPKNLTLREEISEDKEYFERQQRKEDSLSDYKFIRTSFYISPFRIESINNIKDLNGGISFSNPLAKKVFLKADLNFNFYESNNDINSIDKFSTQDLEFDLYGSRLNITKSLDYAMRFNYLQRKWEDVYPVKSQLSFGFIGLNYKRNFNNFNMSLAYAPLFQKWQAERNNQLEDSGIRHAFSLNILSYLTSKWTLTNKLEVMVWGESGFSFDTKNSTLNNTMRMNYKISKHFSLEYQNSLLFDARFRQMDLPSTNFIHQFNIRYTSF